MYRYRLESMNESSRKYGNCECCDKPVSEVFLQVEERQYHNGWTRYRCTPVTFGHKSCLLGLQR